MIGLSLCLAALLPVIPQPTEWTPSEGTCDLNNTNVAVRVFQTRGMILLDEAYRMEITPTAVSIVSDCREGLLRGKATLAQLKAAQQPIPCGRIFDKPKYKVRGFMLDVGRMFHSMDFLRDLAQTMAYYKMNTLHLHLNDNQFKINTTADWDRVYQAFRLECETYPGLTAKDGHYTKKEFREFMLWCRDELGITVIPEFDMPAHSLAFTRYRPDLASTKYGADHFDLAKTDEVLAFVKPLLAEYLTGDNPTFIGPYMHVGTDEYNRAAAEQFRGFSDKLFRMVKDFGYTPCAWGSLSIARGKTPVYQDDEMLMDIWSNDFYNPAEAVAAGYKIVSIPDAWVYIVPYSTFYKNYLDCEWLYKNWDARMVGKYTVPDDKLDHLVGGKFALWNDWCGINPRTRKPYPESENWNRIYPALQTISQKLWTGRHAEQTWEDFAKLANTLQEPTGVKQTHTRKVDEPCD